MLDSVAEYVTKTTFDFTSFPEHCIKYESFPIRISSVNVTKSTPWYIYHTLNDDLLTTFYSQKIKIAKSCEKIKFLVKTYFHKASAKEFTFSEVKKLLTMLT